MAVVGTSGRASSVEHWVAFSKNAFLDILNEILGQPVVVGGGNRKPETEMASYAPAVKRSPTHVDDDESSSQPSLVVIDTLLGYSATSGLPRSGADGKSTGFTGSRLSANCNHVIGFDWRYVGGKPHSVCLPRGFPANGTVTGTHPSATSASTIWSASMICGPSSGLEKSGGHRPSVVGGQLSRRFQPNPNSAIDSVQPVPDGNGADVRGINRPQSQAKVNGFVAKRRLISATSTGSDFLREPEVVMMTDGAEELDHDKTRIADERRQLAPIISSEYPEFISFCPQRMRIHQTVSNQLAPDFKYAGNYAEQARMSTANCSSPFHSTSSTFPGGCRPVSGHRSPNSTFGTSEESGPASSWMAIDKTVLSSVVDEMLLRDTMFGSLASSRFAFPFPVSTGSSYERVSCNVEMATPALMRIPDDDSTSRSTRKPEIARQSFMTSSLQPHRAAGEKDDHLKKRSMYAMANSMSGTRHCSRRDPDGRDLFPFPVYEMAQADDDSFWTGDPRNMGAHAESLKWKSTMLLRMRSEMSVSGS